MKIAKYISNLLFEYECIVVPGLGGFITNEIPSQINSVSNTFTPPTKKIVFNTHLKTNDGLLVNHIAESEKIEYAEANNRVNRFVSRCLEALGQGKRIHFHRIGILQQDGEGYIIYEPETAQNYHPDAFGLASFISPPVKRDAGLRIEKKLKDRKTEKATTTRRTKTTTRKYPEQPRKPRYITINVFSILITIGIIALIFLNFGSLQRFYTNYSSVIPFFYTTPSEYLAMNITEKPFNKLISTNGSDANDNNSPAFVIQNISENLSDNETNDTSVPDESDYETASSQNEEEFEDSSLRDESESFEKQEPGIISQNPETISRDPYSYYIIAGSFENLANAEQYASQLAIHGFDASVVGQNNYGYYRVCYSGFYGRIEAERELAIIRKDENPQAWILAE